MKYNHRIQANGLTERFNQTLQSMLRKYIQDHKDRWDEYIDTCIFAYNTSRQESTLYTPFEIMFGRKALLPVELEKETPIINNVLSDEPSDETIASFSSNRQGLYKKVKANIILAQNNQKKHYDRKHSLPSSFKIGDKVLKRDFLRKKRKGGKLDPKWTGPFMIVQNLGKGFFKLESSANNRIIERINGSHLKPYKDNMLPSSKK